MKSVIKDLYNGELIPCEQYRIKLQNYLDEAQQSYDSFVKKLDSEMAQEFENIMDKFVCKLSEEMEINFELGLQLGVKLFSELYYK